MTSSSNKAFTGLIRLPTGLEPGISLSTDSLRDMGNSAQKNPHRPRVRSNQRNSQARRSTNSAAGPELPDPDVSVQWYPLKKPNRNGSQ